jgi:hypothetical protein
MRYTDGDLRAPQVICFVYNDWTEKKRQVKWSCTLSHPFQRRLSFSFSFPFTFISLCLVSISIFSHWNDGGDSSLFCQFPIFYFLLLFIGRLQASCTRPLGDLLAMN